MTAESNKDETLYFILENSPKKTRGLIGLRSCFYYSVATQKRLQRHVARYFVCAIF